MRTVRGISKYEEIKITTIVELEEYFDNEECTEDNEIVLFSGNMGFWVGKWFNNKFKDSDKGNGDYKVISKEVVQEFIDHCNFILRIGFNEFYDSYEFIFDDDDDEEYIDQVNMEICDVRDEFEKLLNQDFDNNTFVFWSVWGL